ncbi:uncharacterized protein LOC114944443 [Nylanderia fulva]|uniref:uncharacterized protein LOC114944443 n=1 Tax=Nylanderia fulva TaxID=613905 RepID=UPI0010FB75CB|nr:uncharacterized protein LOC114944443 [Nylanderia fulva]
MAGANTSAKYRQKPAKIIQHRNYIPGKQRPHHGHQGEYHHHRSLTLAGTTRTDGTCFGTQFSDPFGTWDNVVVQASIKLPPEDSSSPSDIAPIKDIPEEQIGNPTVTLREDGLYNILSRVALLDEDLPEATIVKCLLSIPKATYNVSRKTVYYTGTFTTTSTTTTKLHRKMEIQALDKSESDNNDDNSAGYVSINLPLLFIQLAIFISSIIQ